MTAMMATPVRTVIVGGGLGGTPRRAVCGTTPGRGSIPCSVWASFAKLTVREQIGGGSRSPRVRRRHGTRLSLVHFAGLLLAHALRDTPGLQVTVYERDESPTSRDQGFVIGLNDDGLRALESVDFPALAAYLAAEGDAAVTGLTLTDSQLGVMMQFAPTAAGSTGDPRRRTLLIDRWQLRTTLATGGIDVVWNKQFKSYVEEGGAAGGVTVHFADGTQARADLVVGADGASSAVRRQRCPNLQLESINVLNCGGMGVFPDEQTHPALARAVARCLARAHGPNGSSVLMIDYHDPRDRGRKIMWAYTAPLTDAVPADDLEQLKAYVDREVAAHFHPEVAEVVARTSLAAMIRGGESLKCIVPVAGNPLAPSTRVTLLGDAFHPMTSHAGLGANTALADAIDLAAALKRPDWTAALAAYEQAMVKRGFANARTSLTMTRVITATNPVGVMMRNGLMRTIGAFAAVLRRFA